MNKLNLLFLAIFAVFLLTVGFQVWAADGSILIAQSQVPAGRAISLDEVILFSQSVGGFLIILGGILAGITIILSGMAYFFAGSNQARVTTAKGILKAGIIGALIIFGAGIIINTIKALATDPLQFFK